MTVENIQDLLAKKVTGEASADELSLLASWSLESDENRLIYDQYESLWSAASDYEPVDFEVDTEAAYQKHLQLLHDSSDIDVHNTQEVSETKEVPSNSNSKTKVISMSWVRSVAAIAILALGAVWLMSPSTTSFEAGDQIQFVSLPDGSSIWLDQGSKLDIKEGFGTDHRDVNLSGKAFFDVNRDENLPFMIGSKDLDVAVLGTSFTVDAVSNVVEVSSGLVNVKTESVTMQLSKGQSASLQGDLLVEGIATKDAAQWRNSDLSFDNADLMQVVADINMFYSDQIVLDGVKSLDCSFTSGSLKGERLDDIILILEKNYDLSREVDKQGNTVLTVRDCH